MSEEVEMGCLALIRSYLAGLCLQDKDTLRFNSYIKLEHSLAGVSLSLAGLVIPMRSWLRKAS